MTAYGNLPPMAIECTMSTTSGLQHRLASKPRPSELFVNLGRHGRCSSSRSATRKNPSIVAMAASRTPRPSLVPLTSQELARVLPWSASSHLIAHEFGNAMDWAVRVNFSLASSMCIFWASQTTAALAFFFWLWGPMWLAWLRSSQLRLFLPYAGIWQARVLTVESIGALKPHHSETLLHDFFQKLYPPQSVIRLEIGDDSSARLQFEVPVYKKSMLIQVGEPAEVLVLSDRANLSRFKSVQEVYFPRIGMWLSKTPYIEKSVFEALSCDLKVETPYEDSFSMQGISWEDEMYYSASRIAKGNRPLLGSGKEQSSWLQSKERSMVELADDFDY